MDFSVIYQLRSKRYWWLDVILYFAVSLLVATIFCWLIFMVKGNLEQEKAKKIYDNLLTVGTADQKAQEKNVLSYKKKISDFNVIFKNHEFASNIFAFMREQTLPYIWFKQFALDKKNGLVQLSGETDNLDFLSRQVSSLEKNSYVKKIGTLNSSIGTNTKINFSLNISLDPKIFGYVADTAIEKTTSETLGEVIKNNTTP